MFQVLPMFERATSAPDYEKLQLPGVVTPPISSQSQLSAVVLEEVPGLFGMFSDHVEARGNFSEV